MRKLLLLCLLLPCLAWARPVQSPRGLTTFDVPANLPDSGGSSWGQHPGMVISVREECAPKGELKSMIWSLAPPSPDAKKSKEEGVEIDGAEGKSMAVKKGANYARFLFLRRGGWNYGWSVFSMQAKPDEVDAVFERLKESVRFNPDPSAMDGENSRSVRDQAGMLEVMLPGKFAPVDARKYSNGEMMVILTSMRQADEAVLRDFAFKYTPPGYSSYMRRNNVEMGDHKGALILATSTDGQLESQMVMLSREKQAVVLTFIAPVRLRGPLSVLREAVASQARWVGGE
jgi:hypothetical protein